jgi:hypothetical protein
MAGTKERRMPQIKGKFDVKRTAEPNYDVGGGVEFGRSRFDKRFQGDLEGTSVVYMLSVGTPTKGSAAYVALELIEGSVAGRKGTFVVTHTATMARGVPSMALTVVPDSGTAELAGIGGKMVIDIVEGQHFYTLDYAFAE